MMKNLLGIALTLILFNGLKCEKPNKDDPEPTPEDTLYANDTFLRYWYFPKGSWWVYKRMDTNVKVYDTVRVKNTIRKMSYKPDYADVMWERITLNMTHSASHFEKINKGKVLIQNLAIHSAFVNRVSSSGHKAYFGYNYFFSWPIDSNLIYKKSNGRSVLVDQDNIKVPYGSLSNKNVHLKYDNKSHIWLSKDIGFVKYVHPDSSVWELVNYKIKK